MAGDMQLYKIQACKFDYEYMGKSVTSLARQYDFPEDAIRGEISAYGWERKIEPTSMPKTSNIEDFAVALESLTRSRLSIISLFRQIENQPLIAQLETVFLEKALELASNLDSADDRSSSKLINLVKAIQALQDRNPIDLAKQLEDANKNGKGAVIVNIANQLH